MFDYEKLEDFDTYRHYMINDDNVCGKPIAPLNKVLSTWEQAKSDYLFNLFGNELILSRPIEYEDIELQNKSVHKVFYKYYELFKSFYKSTIDMGDQFFLEGLGYELDGNNTTVLYHPRTINFSNNTTINIHHGEKLTRVFLKIAKLLGKEEEYKHFLDEYSLARSSTKSKGTLCLSIHPLDYATASDNANGWSSCMAWYDHEGDYRLGTIEMMNSQAVICAYLASDDEKLELPDHVNWNSKNWRAWIIVTPEVIAVNKHYPYKNDYFAETCLDWVAELAEKNLDWHFAAKERLEKPGRYFNADNCYMYNDFHSLDDALIRKQVNLVKVPAFTYPGYATCLTCGEIIDYDDYPIDMQSNHLSHMNEGHRCYDCGTILIGENDYYCEDNGEYYCEDCANERLYYCPICGMYHLVENSYTIAIPYSRNYISIDVCENCLNHENVEYCSEDGYYIPSIKYNTIDDILELFESSHWHKTIEECWHGYFNEALEKEEEDDE